MDTFYDTTHNHLQKVPDLEINVLGGLDEGLATYNIGIINS